MLYVEVVLGLPIEGPFDYAVPDELSGRIKPGMRVGVPFGPRKMTGYVVKVKPKTKIKKIRSILELIDAEALLSEDMLTLARRVSDYYCCSWGEAIETGLPGALRRGKKVALSFENKSPCVPAKRQPERILLHAPKARRWEVYLEKIKSTLHAGRSVIALAPDVDAALKLREFVARDTGNETDILFHSHPRQLQTWLKAREGKTKIIVGTRSAVFAPQAALGLIIFDDEHHSAYKQEQSPHYHAREVAYVRSDIEGSSLLLGSASPSLESIYSARSQKLNYSRFAQAAQAPEVKVIDMKQLPQSGGRKGLILSQYLQDAIASVVGAKGSVLVFLNRKGFATLASCHKCGKAIKCQRCNAYLVYHFKEDKLLCHYCSFSMNAPKACPFCNSAYIRYSGVGTEKAESELARLMPQAKIKIADPHQPGFCQAKDADITVSTEGIIGKSCEFDLTACLSADNYINRIDLRASERAFALLTGLLGLTKDKLIIQTNIASHPCFTALRSGEPDIFYDEELKQRQQLGFPPYKHMACIKLRSGDEEKVKGASLDYFKRLKRVASRRQVEVLAVGPANPAKLRSKFYWQILLVSDDALKISGFLKKYLWNLSHSGIIVTVDIDPL